LQIRDWQISEAGRAALRGLQISDRGSPEIGQINFLRAEEIRLRRRAGDG
jgi:hypothetical protein